MSETAAGTWFAEPIERIQITLRDSSRSHIILAVADDPTLRREAMARVAQRLSGAYALHEFDYAATSEPSLPRFCRALNDDLPSCVLAHGLEAIGQDKSAYRAALDLLNAHREDIRDTKTALILWLSAAAHADVLQYAPDFADWRSADVTFAPPDGNISVTPTTLGKLAIADAERLRAQVRRYEEMLRRPGLDKTLAAEYQKQLGYAQKQLGLNAESKSALSASSKTAVAQNDFKQLESLYRQHVIDKYSKLTLYSVNSDAPLSIDLERVFVKLSATCTKISPLWLAGSYIDTRSYQRILHDLSKYSQEAFIQPEDYFVPENVQKRWEASQNHSKNPVDFINIRICLRGELSRLSSDQTLFNILSHSSSDSIKDELEVVTTGDAFKRNLYIAVIGTPGAGKTTLLKYLALTFARNQAAKRLGIDEKRLPVFITLRDFSRYLETAPDEAVSPDTLPLFLQRYFSEAAPHLNLPEMFFRSALQEKRCIVLLDGLDEVADTEKRLRVTDVIAASLRFYVGNRFVVSSRPRGYEGDARQRLGAQCAEYTIRDFDDEDMSEFAHRWYEAVTRDRIGHNAAADQEAKTKAEDLLTAIKADARVRALAHNPLLLSVLAMVHQRGATLPQRRTELYDECTDLLLGYWDQTKSGATGSDAGLYGGLSRSERRVLLEPIALWMHERGEAGQEVTAAELETQLVCQFQEVLGDREERAKERARKFLQLIVERTGLLVERENGVYAFSHLTFQEYLAARAIADREDYIEFTLEHLHDAWWQETLLLEVGHVSDVCHYGRRARKLTTDLVRAIYEANSRLESILKRDLLFAARAIADIGTLGIDEALRQQIVTELLELWRTKLPAEQRSSLISVFAYLLPTQDGPFICAKLLDDVAAATIDSDWMICDWLVEAFRHFGGRAATQEVISRLLDFTTQKDPNAWNVNRIAVEIIGALGFATPEVINRLQSLTLSQNGTLAYEAVNALIKLCINNSSEAARVCLTEMSASSEMRFAVPVLEAKSRNPSAWSDAETFLINASANPEHRLRMIAIEGLGALVQNAPTTEIMHRLFALVDEATVNVDQRKKAIHSLSHVKNDKWTIQVRDRLLLLLRDAKWEVRYVAAEALGSLGAATATPEIIDSLVEQFASEAYPKRNLSFSVLKSMSAAPVSAQTVERLIVLTKHSNPTLRRQAIELLSSYGSKAATAQAVARLLKLAASKDLDTSLRAIEALGSIGGTAPDKTILDALLTLTHNADTNVQYAAIEAIRILGQFAATPITTARLAEILRVEHLSLQTQAAVTLSSLGTEDCGILQQLAVFWQEEYAKNADDRYFNLTLAYARTTAYSELQRAAGLLPRVIKLKRNPASRRYCVKKPGG